MSDLEHTEVDARIEFVPAGVYDGNTLDLSKFRKLYYENSAAGALVPISTEVADCSVRIRCAIRDLCQPETFRWLLREAARCGLIWHACMNYRTPAVGYFGAYEYTLAGGLAGEFQDYDMLDSAAMPARVEDCRKAVPGTASCTYRMQDDTRRKKLESETAAGCPHESMSFMLLPQDDIVEVRSFCRECGRHVSLRKWSRGSTLDEVLKGVSEENHARYVSVSDNGTVWSDTRASRTYAAPEWF